MPVGIIQVRRVPNTGREGATFYGDRASSELFVGDTAWIESQDKCNFTFM